MNWAVRVACLPRLTMTAMNLTLARRLIPASVLLLIVAVFACHERRASRGSVATERAQSRALANESSRGPTPPHDLNSRAVIHENIPPETWLPAEISPGKRPVKILVRKFGWRGGSAALVIADRRRVQALYDSLAGNQRIGWTCGYHWRFLFEFDGGGPESIDVNENCETFRRDPKRTWRLVSDAFRSARAHPRTT